MRLAYVQFTKISSPIKVLGRVFRELQLIEQWGSGLNRIGSVCQQQNSAANAADPDEERPGRHQQKSTQTQPPVEGILADTVGPGSCTYTPPLPAIPGKDLEQIIRDRIGYSTSLSRLDLEKLIALKNKHGPSFYTACGYLHGRVTNAAAFLAAILEPRDPTEVFATKLKALMQAESVISAPQSGSGHG